MTTLLTAAGFLWRQIWRYRWAFSIPIATLVLPAVIYAVRLTDEYRAPALVHVRVIQPEHIGRGLPEERGTRPEEALATVRARLRADTPVSAAAAKLYPDEAADGVRATEMTRARIAYEQIGSSAFSVSVAAPDPESAAEGTNALVRAFLENERALRVRRAENNSAFHQKALTSARSRYHKALEALDVFRREHGRTLPESLEGTREVLRRTASDMTAQDSVISVSRRRIQELDGQLASLEATMPPGAAPTSDAASEAMRLQLSQAQRALHGAKKELAELRARYTEQHPDVLRLKTAMRVHESAVSEAVAALRRVRAQALDDATRSAGQLLASRRKGLMQLRRVALEEVAEAESRKLDLRKRESELHELLIAVPGTEAALAPLRRELDEAAKVLAVRHQDTSAARAAVEFYSSGECADVTQFRIDAWAAPPVHPSGPARWRYLAAAFLIGTVLGYGLFLLRRKLEGSTVEATGDVAGLYPNAVVVEVPDLGSGPRRRIGLGDVLLSGYVLGCIALSVAAVAVQRGWTDGPVWIQKLVQG